ncbi:MAG: hypothetical protein JWM90_2846 [Thermoleophilia bacterium]|nr:hypothetical protein [Thermoleophilia bacterium]
MKTSTAFLIAFGNVALVMFLIGNLPVGIMFGVLAVAFGIDWSRLKDQA